jgi:RNA polymerase sigma-70 factor, ECF subfamily
MSDTAVFEAERPGLLGLAYRLLGSLVDAEDVVQEAWIRWDAADTDAIDRPPAWLTTVTTRLALDRIRSAEHRRAAYVGPWLPEPVALDTTPEDAAELAESLTFGFLVLLDQLSGIERAVLLLADVFRQPFREIAETVGRTEAACRQIASRARRRLREAGADRHSADDALLAKLVEAMALGDAPALLELLHPDVVLVSDGGANRHAGRRPVLGPERVARVLLNLTKRMVPDASLEFQQVNLRSAVVIRMGGETIVVQVDQTADRAEAIRVVVNPDKTRHLDEPVRLT